MLSEKLMKIINDWDPIDIKSFTPENEYASEVKEIEKFLAVHNNVNTALLAEKIMDVFVQSFGADIFKKQLKECETIAKKILDLHISSKNDSYKM